MAEILQLTGKNATAYLDEVARLRITVFREFPYLYDGSEAYERGYLETYVKSENSIIVVAVKENRVIGASTGLPLTEADEAFQKPFVEAGIDPKSIFYFGESVVEKSERGHGLGHRFFEEREAHASKLGYAATAFCAIERAENHPLRPIGHRTNNAFWAKRGYRPQNNLRANLGWQQIDGQPEDVPNSLIFWIKDGSNDHQDYL